MTAWQDRPQVAAAYLNPAMVATVLAAAAAGYRTERQRTMIWPLAFVVAPLVLHRSTRQALPRSTTTHLASWVSRNALLHTGFAARARALTPTVREGLRFGLRHGVLTVEAGGLSGAVGKSRDPELRQLLRSAQLVGRWLAKADEPGTAFAILGVEP
ncbi:three component ABC system middle component [Micromonospora sp. WMMD737]|uniref:three component ABC system middle component n=1 Tax=Micromonospora sp. WMMD737 TaxID=3404113 RepID=UPI003B94CE6C